MQGFPLEPQRRGALGNQEYSRSTVYCYSGLANRVSQGIINNSIRII